MNENIGQAGETATPDIDTTTKEVASDRLCLEARVMSHYLKLSTDAPALADTIAQLEGTMMAEEDGNSQSMDRRLIEQVILLDAAFRFYLSGGEAEKPDERSFLLALKAQEQSITTMNAVRMNRARCQQYDVAWNEHISKSRSRMLRNSEKIAKNAERTDRALQKRYYEQE